MLPRPLSEDEALSHLELITHPLTEGKEGGGGEEVPVVSAGWVGWGEVKSTFPSCVKRRVYSHPPSHNIRSNLG